MYVISLLHQNVQGHYTPLLRTMFLAKEHRLVCFLCQLRVHNLTALEREVGRGGDVSYTKTKHNDPTSLIKVTVCLSERRGEVLWCVLIVQAMNRTYMYHAAM